MLRFVVLRGSLKLPLGRLKKGGGKGREGRLAHAA
jgi:hypothetical protein